MNSNRRHIGTISRIRFFYLTWEITPDVPFLDRHYLTGKEAMDILAPIIMGILLGGLYTLIALRMSMVSGVMRLINLAHGDLVILGSYLSFALLTKFGIDPVVSLVVTVPVLFGLGFLLQHFLMRRAAAISEAPP